MSLIAWYPLNGDTLDYSGNENHATNYGATIDVNGKIGKCYSFDGIDDGIATPWKPTEFFTLGMWFYKSDWGADGYENLIGAYSTTFELHTKVSTTNEPYLRLYSWGGATVAYELNRWNHVLLVRTPSGTKLYLNGELKITGRAGSLPNEQYYIGCWRNNTIQNFKGKINDVRFYDHALSQKEIQDLAKAKVLHYTFDDFQEPTVNLLSQPLSFETGYTKESWSGTITDNSILSPDGTMTACTIERTAGYFYKHSSYSPTITIAPGDTITFSCWVKKLDSSSQVNKGIAIWCYSGSSRLVAYANQPIYEDKWVRQEVTYTAGVGETSFSFIFSGGSANTLIGKIGIWHPQLEKKDHATPFTPNTRDGIVRDMSGYGNHASLGLDTTPKWTEDSRIGSGAYEFNGSQFIEPKSSIMNCLIYNDFTISLWLNTKDFTGEICDIFGGGSYGNSTGGVALSRYLTNAWYLDIYLNSSGRRSIALNSSSIIPNKWNLITVSRDRVSNSLGIYVNDSLISSINIPNENILWNQSSFPLKFGKGHYSGTQGLIDDVRIYATALSEEDIKELYQTRASLDDKGNLYLSQIRQSVPTR